MRAKNPFSALAGILAFACGTALAVAGPDDILARLVAANDAIIARARAAPTDAAGGGAGWRGEAVRVLVYACGYVSPISSAHHDVALVTEMTRAVDALASAQHASGLFDAGNLESPPDTAFMLEALAKAQRLLVADADPRTATLREKLRIVIERAAAGVARGGVHTPNHRWGVCAALAATHRLYPDLAYTARIAEWLAEGIDQDADGQYSERSPAYSAAVVNPALMTLADFLGRADLREHVRRNLALTWRLMEPNGDLVTLASRRQDQKPGVRVSIAEYYLPGRWLAVRDGDRFAAALARWIEEHHANELAEGVFDPNWPLPFLLEEPVLAAELPPGDPLPTDYVAQFPGSGLVRVRRGAVTATLYGGSDHGTGFGVASGLATNPAFFSFRHGAALVSARLTPAFFGTGFFHADGVSTLGDGAWRLRQKLSVPYHLPLPAEWRRADGGYALTPDGRFFSRMDFPHRPKEFRELETEVTAREQSGGMALTIEVRGQAGVPVTLELTVGAEGTLDGVIALAEAAAPRRAASWLRRPAIPRERDDRSEAFVLRGERARFAVGTDAIEFGPGIFTRAPGAMESDAYRWVGGSARAPGRRIYLTGVTPFRHELRFAAVAVGSAK